MRLLAIDTATEACSAAVLTEAGLFPVLEEVGRGHAERILFMVELVLGRAGITLARLDGIAASVGPGSFTGVRISVAVAQGLAFGAQLPVVAVTTLEALAWRAVRDGASQVLACLDARMGEVYWGCFAADAERGLVTRGASAVNRPLDVRVPFDGLWTGIGRGFAAYPTLAALPGVNLAPGGSGALPDAAQIATLGEYRLRAGEGVDPGDLIPIYLRDKVAFTEAEREASQSKV